MDKRPTFGALLRHYRLAAGLTQEDLASRAGLSARAITDLERGARRFPYEDTRRRLAEALGITDTERVSFEVAGQRPSPSARDHARPTLPASLTSFIGRTRELITVKSLLTQAPVVGRLVTLTGSPGTGKTRLALQVAAALSGDFADGVWFVPLASIRDPSLVVSAIAHALGVREVRDQPLVERLITSLRARSALLVLDNFEQILAAAPLLTDLLGSCPGLEVLVTSRAALRLHGEREFLVPSLTLPEEGKLLTPEQALQYEAVRLFAERAQAVRSEFSLTEETAAAVAEICRRLDGLPLAIELAAARSKLLSPEALLARLGNRLAILVDGPRDRPARHRTMRSALDWSYELLEPAQQRVFRRLAVFVGGCTLEAATEVVLGPGQLGPPSTDVLEGMASLVDNSLLRLVERQSSASRRSGPNSRLAMLESVRDYAWDRLIASGEVTALREQHAGFFQMLVSEAESELHAPEQTAWLDRLEDEIDNLRAMLRWSLDTGTPEPGLRAAGALWLFWTGRGYITEGRRWLAALLDLPGAAEETPGRGKALFTAGMLAWYQADHSPARTLHDGAMVTYQHLGDRHGVASAFFGLGQVALGQGDYTLARSLHTEALTLRRDLGDRWEIAFSLIQLGLVVHEQGDCATARALYEEGLGLRRQVGDHRGAEFALFGLAKVAQDQGDHALACSLYAESLAVADALDDRWGLAHAVAGFAELAAVRGQAERALLLAGAASGRLEAIGAALFPAWQTRFDLRLERARQELGHAASAAAWAAGRAMPPEQTITYALAALDAPDLVPISQPPTIPTLGLHGTQLVPLTRREREVVMLIARGFTNRQIAAELVIATRTADTHVEHILDKLGLPSRAQAAVWAAAHGLLATCG
jgi:non-specific serine/threonine protein kinase